MRVSFFSNEWNSAKGKPRKAVNSVCGILVLLGSIILSPVAQALPGDYI